ncbi:YjjG family noncanonical pyrimidine nucleotidase [Cesiribacter andamanensis]|uniref:Putative HAD-hydrolase yfnB n=1 Tax=Cesiribacter andamanensis AMV16 TaxID=1279009 RepID=M7MX18_9BACT|nr:YjjG family noncanonical pyrimidine nucleotidase [Cesiribacter andamanensis]EMR00973.1 Putative HAD-hydrolase yfnB [Cesiribacter andamanensis AMV16]
MRPLKARYRYLFFDLDHTLWDFSANSEATLRELYQTHQLAQLGNFCSDTFCKTFETINYQLWDLNESGKLQRDELRRLRFVRVLQALGAEADEHIASELDKAYLSQCPAKPGLLPFAREVLEHVQGRYPLYILTNGFRDVQAIKLSASGIGHYFAGVFTAEDAGVAKPDALFFEHVLRQTGARGEECLMIGDNLKADIIGAAAAGIDSVYYNPYKRRYHVPVQQEIHCLSELLRLL